MNPWDLSCRPRSRSGSTGGGPATALNAIALRSPRMKLSLNQATDGSDNVSSQQASNYKSPSLSSSFDSLSSSSQSPLSPSSTSSSSFAEFDAHHFHHPSSSQSYHRRLLLTTGDIISSMASSSCSQENKDVVEGQTSSCNLSATPDRLLDRKARKKDQNRRAAFNYRRKKMEEKNRMREEEMRLVYSRVCLIGYADELESTIMYILNTRTRKVLDKDGKPVCVLCPICLRSCDNTLNLRNHLNVLHCRDTVC